MTLLNRDKAIGDYLSHLNNDFQALSLEGNWILTTPFVKPDGEGVELELRTLPNGNISVRDMGNTVGYLYVNGLTLSKAIMTNARSIAQTHGVILSRNELSIAVSPESLGMGIHSLIQAALGVSSLIYKRRPTTSVRFDDEVESFIIRSGVVYDVNFAVGGERERHVIKFHVNSDKNLLIHPLSVTQEATARSWAERLAYKFSDILKVSSHWRPVAVLDDRSERLRAWSDYARIPVEEYAVQWSDKEKLGSVLEGMPRTNDPRLFH